MSGQYFHDEADILRGIATARKNLMIYGLEGFIHFFSIMPIRAATFERSSEPSGFGEALLLGWFHGRLVLLVFYLALVGRLNFLLGKSAGERIAFALLIVFINLMAVLVVNRQATTRLKQAGLTVGFLESDLQKLADRLTGSRT